MTISIEHQPDKHRFLSIVDGHECVLEYRITSDPKVWDYHHTYVAPELRGQHIAEQITTFAMDYARSHGIKIIPTCPYVLRFLGIHTEYKDLVV
jgi:predicted GNAT family acetyltransferase